MTRSALLVTALIGTAGCGLILDVNLLGPDAAVADADADVDGNTPSSCDEVRTRDPDMEDGWYDVLVEGVVERVFCSVGRDGEAWARVTRLDAGQDPCPEGLVTEPAFAGCSVAGELPCDGSVVTMTFPAPAGTYSRVRGCARGVQYKSTDGFVLEPHGDPGIDGIYVDGLSITRGSPRHHVWTFAAALDRGPCHEACPGDDPAAAQPPPYVGESYFCDSGRSEPACLDYEDVWYDDAPLWDGDGTDPDCSGSDPSTWFSVDLGEATSDPIEVRIMFDECDENLALSRLVVDVR